MNRKGFIQRALNTWAAIISIPLLYGVTRYITPSPGVDAAPAVIPVGKRSEFQQGRVKVVREGRHTLLVRKNQAGEIESFSARCPHLGCTVEYLGEKSQFRCNCHGSLFDEKGHNLNGPATRPLQPYPVEVRGDEVLVTVI